MKTDQSPPANISKQTETRTRISHQSTLLLLLLPLLAFGWFLDNLK